MKFQRKQLGQGLALATLMAAAGTVSGADQGELGATSKGSLDVSAVIADRVQISGLNDITLGSFDGTAELSSSDDFCIYRNGTGSYSVEIESANAAENGAFRMSSEGLPELLLYTVEFAGNPVSSGDEVEGTGDPSSPTCGGVPNTTLGVRVALTDLAAATTGTYSDTITMVVKPL